MPTQKKRVQAFLSDELYQALSEYRQIHQVSVSEAVVNLLEKALNISEKKNAIAETEYLTKKQFIKYFGSIFKDFQDSVNQWMDDTSKDLEQSGVKLNNPRDFSFDIYEVMESQRLILKESTHELEDELLSESENESRSESSQEYFEKSVQETDSDNSSSESNDESRSESDSGISRESNSEINSESLGEPYLEEKVSNSGKDSHSESEGESSQEYLEKALEQAAKSFLEDKFGPVEKVGSNNSVSEPSNDSRSEPDNEISIKSNSEANSESLSEPYLEEKVSNSDKDSPSELSSESSEIISLSKQLGIKKTAWFICLIKNEGKFAFWTGKEFSEDIKQGKQYVSEGSTSKGLKLTQRIYQGKVIRPHSMDDLDTFLNPSSDHEKL